MRILHALCLLITLLTAPAGVLAADKPLKATIYAMGGIPINISAWDLEQDDFDTAIEKISQRIEYLEAMMSTYRADSEISRINRGETLEDYPRELADVVRRSLSVSETTDGAFDITVEPLVELWRGAVTLRRLPTDEEYAEALSKVGYRQVLVERDGTVRLAQFSVQLDLGGVAKGYFADEAVLILRKAGSLRSLVDCGGDVTTWNHLAGPHAGDTFRVGIKNPLNRDEILAVLELDSGAVVTSGNYERYYEIDGRRYCHIFDPRTGEPVEGMLSVTLLAGTGIFADAFATAVFVMGPQGGREFIEANRFLDAVIISDDGKGGMELWVSEGLKNRLKFVD